MNGFTGAEAQIPYRSYSEIEWEATIFLRKYWNGLFPVDVDEICDKNDIGIIYIPNLKRQFGLDAYTTSDFKTIVVDEMVLNNDNRYRFCISHELRHIVLHKEYYPSNIHDVETYLKYANGYVSGPAESQADIFASILLIPAHEIREGLVDKFGDEVEENIKKSSLSEIVKIFSELSEHFGVPTEILRKRIEFAFPNIINAIKNRR
ncbi:MAG: ImmA/IrrE family metallo-endopeptidase [Candidatus Saccharibacteria bacterium]|nr:ImmA/IrrE family metallo-endopeptidase [Candidatus Saccharibacteria bacterium]